MQRTAHIDSTESAGHWPHLTSKNESTANVTKELKFKIPFFKTFYLYERETERETGIESDVPVSGSAL